MFSLQGLQQHFNKVDFIDQYFGRLDEWSLVQTEMFSLEYWGPDSCMWSETLFVGIW